MQNLPGQVQGLGEASCVIVAAFAAANLGEALVPLDEDLAAKKQEEYPCQIKGLDGSKFLQSQNEEEKY